MVATIALGFVLRDYSLSKVSAFYTDDVAVLSPARLTAEEIGVVYRTAITNAQIKQKLGAIGPAKLVVYVVPQEWYLPDLPLEVAQNSAGHKTPADFNLRNYKVLFTKVRSHAVDAKGVQIVKSAHGRDSVTVARVDVSVPAVTGVAEPPRFVLWGDIPTSMF